MDSFIRQPKFEGLFWHVTDFHDDVGEVGLCESRNCVGHVEVHRDQTERHQRHYHNCEVVSTPKGCLYSVSVRHMDDYGQHDVNVKGLNDP